MVNATYVDPLWKSTALWSGLPHGFASAEPPLGNLPYRVVWAEPPHPKGLTAPVAEAPLPVPRPTTVFGSWAAPSDAISGAAILKTALTIVCSETCKPEHRMTTILVCHLRWKGEEDTNPCACILVQCLRREVDDHLDRWRYGGNK